MLPGKKYAPEDVVRVVKRRFWLLALPFAVIAAATAVFARLLPDSYRSDTLILVVPQRVPESYVKSTVTTRIEDRLQAISQQILSRTRLERVIQDFDLYAEQRRSGIMEDIVQKMRDDIEVQVVKGDAFRVSYVGGNPRTVMKVTERLSSLFIEESLRDREVLAEGTNQFLEAQLEDSKRRLVESEKKLEAYKRQHAGQLPTQVDSNLQAIQNYQTQIQVVVDSLGRDRDARETLERQIADLEALAALPPPPPPPQPVPQIVRNPGERTAAEELEAARNVLAVYETTKKPDHPDIGIARRAVRDLEKKAAAEAARLEKEREKEEAEAKAAAAERRGPTPAEFARERQMNEARARIASIDRRLEEGQAQLTKLRAVVAGYQARLEAVPTRESEMIELMRDYDTLQKNYQSLLAKKEDSKIAANLERRQIGEQFKLLDPARLPERPFSPNRQLINMAGLLGGLLFGVVLVGLLEYRDSTFKTDDDVMSVLALPVLAVVPLMESKVDRKVHRRRKFLIGAGLGTTVAACLALVVYTFVR
jgi:polysaccharide chain length determinant protein (PEP-CTERM system associated)